MTPQADVCVTVSAESTRSAGLLTVLRDSERGAGMHDEDDWMRHAFNGPELHDAISEEAHHGSQEEVDQHVQEILREVVESRHSKPGESWKLKCLRVQAST